MALLLNTVKQNWNHVSDALTYVFTRLVSKTVYCAFAKPMWRKKKKEWHH